MRELTKAPELAKRGRALLASGPVQIHLGVETDFRPARIAHPAIRCANYDALVAHVRNAGIDVRDDGMMHDGTQHAYIDDLFGNRLELIQTV